MSLPNNQQGNSSSHRVSTSAILDAILRVLDYRGPRSRRQYMCRCPAHDDHTPSLSVRMTADERILLHCFAGCRIADILRAMGLTLRDLVPATARTSARARAAKAKPVAFTPPLDIAFFMRRPPRQAASAPVYRTLGKIVAEYDYRDENGRLVCQVVRFEPKSFRQRQPDIDGSWFWSMQCVRPPLYRLPELLSASVEDWIFVVEGEKDVDALRQLGLTATCNIQGAGKWKPEYNHWLANRHVCILPDNDEAGRQHAQTVAEQLSSVARRLHILELPGLPARGDASDWLARGGDGRALLALLDHAINPPCPASNHSAIAAEGNDIAYARPGKGGERPVTDYRYVLTEGLGYHFACNELDNSIEVNGYAIDRALMAEIHSKMRALGYSDTQTINDAYSSHAHSQSYHPVKRYLQSLVWDQRDHIAGLAAHLHTIHAPICYNSGQTLPVAHVWLLRFLIGAVANVYNDQAMPGQPPMFVLQGAQGMGKSTFVHWLGSPLPWLTYAGGIGAGGKNTPRLLASKWITIDIHQLWAQAHALYRQGEPWRLRPEEAG